MYLAPTGGGVRLKAMPGGGLGRCGVVDLRGCFKTVLSPFQALVFPYSLKKMR